MYVGNPLSALPLEGLEVTSVVLAVGAWRHFEDQGDLLPSQTNLVLLYRT
jgi:hypothetical protein